MANVATADEGKVLYPLSLVGILLAMQATDQNISQKSSTAISRITASGVWCRSAVSRSASLA